MPEQNEPVDIRALLGRPMSDFPDLPDLPAKKDFFGKIIGIQSKLSSKQQTPFFQIDARLTDPGPNVTPADLKPITDGGFSLSDYEVWCEFYLTPKSMVMFRRFLTSLGFAENMNFIVALKLDDDLNPTPATMEILQGMDVVCQTQAPYQGRVFNKLQQMTGTKKD